MPLFGPRLDAPTAIGDEGRPRATGLAIASVAVAAVAVAIAVGTEMRGLIGGVASMTGFVVAGMALMDRDRFGTLAIGHLFFIPTTIMVVGFVLAGPFVHRPSALLILGGLAMAIGGMGTAWANVDADHLATVNRQAWIATLLAMVALPVVLVGLAALIVLGGALVPGAVLPATGPDLDGLAVLIAVTAALLALAVTWLPIVEFAPADRRSTVAVWRRVLRIAFVATALLAVICWVPLAILELIRTPTISPTIDRLLASPVLRGTALVVALVPALVGAGVAGLRMAIRWLTRGVDGDRARQIAPIVGAAGIVLMGVILVGLIMLGMQTGTIATPAIGAIQLLAVAVVSAVIAAVIALVVLVPLALAVVATRLEIVPDRAGPIAIAAAGLVAVAIGVGTVGPVWAPIGVVLAALLVWDQGEFALGLTGELGHRPPTRGVALVHAGVALAVGVALGGLAVGTLVLVESVALAPALGVVALAALAALIALVPLRR